ncbi:MAG: hypothetical protein Q9220_004426 [cf. Caloplaca sp. 1 TL-2023]
MSSSSRELSAQEDGGQAPPSDHPHEQTSLPMSKNKLKKLRRDQAWEEGREKRKELRKLKQKEKRERKRDACTNDTPSGQAGNKRKAEDETENHMPKRARHQHAIQLPVSFIIDCGFDDLMLDGERKSLASQVTRSYSDNHKAPFRAHLTVSSFGGHLKERFDNVLSGHHQSWKGVTFLEDDFEKAAGQATELMKSDTRAKLTGAFEAHQKAGTEADTRNAGEVVYLTSDSPDTLTELKPYSTYIIGGIVDRNRHKGICYKRAMDRGMKTAKLPIGDYMKMASRFVLATNHVAEIMLKWLELGDWGQAFLQVIPSRKGGVLKDNSSAPVGASAELENEGGTREEPEEYGHEATAISDDAVHDTGNGQLVTEDMVQRESSSHNKEPP